MAESKYCTQCGAKLSGSDRFCKKCGAQGGRARAAKSAGAGFDLDLSFDTSKKAAHTKEIADIWIRLVALIIDSLILSAVSVALFFLMAFLIFIGGFFVFFFFLGPFFLIGAFYYIFFHYTKGQTLGKMMMNIKVVDVHFKDITLETALIRYIGRVVCGLIIVGFLLALFDKNRQGLHDMMAHTYVVNTK